MTEKIKNITGEAFLGIGLFVLCLGLLGGFFLMFGDDHPESHNPASIHTVAVAHSPTPYPPTVYGSAPPMDIRVFNDGMQIEDGAMFTMLWSASPLKTASEYLATLDITFWAEDFDSVHPMGPTCVEPYFCPDISHPGPEPNPSIQSWPRPRRVDFSNDGVIFQPTQIAVTYTWEDDEFFGHGFGGQCNSCPLGANRIETKDEDFTFTIVMNIVPCDVDASIEVVDQGPHCPGDSVELEITLNNNASTEIEIGWRLNTESGVAGIEDVSFSPIGGLVRLPPMDTIILDSSVYIPDDISVTDIPIDFSATAILAPDAYLCTETTTNIEVAEVEASIVSMSPCPTLETIPGGKLYLTAEIENLGPCTETFYVAVTHDYSNIVRSAIVSAGTVILSGDTVSGTFRKETIMADIEIEPTAPSGDYTIDIALFSNRNRAFKDTVTFEFELLDDRNFSVSKQRETVNPPPFEGELGYVQPHMASLSIVPYCDGLNWRAHPTQLDLKYFKEIDYSIPDITGPNGNSIGPDDTLYCLHLEHLIAGGSIGYHVHAATEAHEEFHEDRIEPILEEQKNSYFRAVSGSFVLVLPANSVTEADAQSRLDSLKGASESTILTVFGNRFRSVRNLDHLNCTPNIENVIEYPIANEICTEASANAWPSCTESGIIEDRCAMAPYAHPGVLCDPNILP